MMVKKQKSRAMINTARLFYYWMENTELVISAAFHHATQGRIRSNYRTSVFGAAICCAVITNRHCFATTYRCYLVRINALTQQLTNDAHRARDRQVPVVIAT